MITYTAFSRAFAITLASNLRFSRALAVFAPRPEHFLFTPVLSGIGVRRFP